MSKIDKAFADIFEVLKKVQSSLLASQNTHQRDEELRKLAIAIAETEIAQMLVVRSVMGKHND